MKQRTLLTKPKPVPFKALYLVKHYIRSYEDRKHPELYLDYEVKTRTSKPHLLDNIAADAYQFYDVLEVSYVGQNIDNTVTDPRNFSKLYFAGDVEEEEDDE